MDAKVGELLRLITARVQPVEMYVVDARPECHGAHYHQRFWSVAAQAWPCM